MEAKRDFKQMFEHLERAHKDDARLQKRSASSDPVPPPTQKQRTLDSMLAPHSKDAPPAQLCSFSPMECGPLTASDLVWAALCCRHTSTLKRLHLAWFARYFADGWCTWLQENMLSLTDNFISANHLHQAQ